MTETTPRSQDPASSPSIFDTGPPPPDLTQYIIKTGDQYLAGGGFGDVYKRWYVHGSKQQEVAVKALRFKSTLDGDTEDKSVKMLRRELGIWKRLSHNNIVPFLGIAYGFGMSGAMSLVSLWMPNGALHIFLATHDSELATPHRLQILHDVSKGLHYLHSFPIVHGDLNSNNVLLDANYAARLADFGYASVAGYIPEALTYLQRSTARPGALRWIAPEQIDLEGTYNKTIKSDIYSFGCVALQGSSSNNVLSGKQPWSEVREDASVVLRLHLGHKPSRPESRTMGDSQWDFIQRCWLPVQDRPTTDIILHALQQLLSDCPPSKPLYDLFILSSTQTQDPFVKGLSTSLTKPFATEGSKTNETPLDKVEDDQTSHPQSKHSVAAPSRLPARYRYSGWTVVEKFKPAIQTPSVLLHGLWNKIKWDSSENEIVIFVVGPEGSGKTWFIREATNRDLSKVGKVERSSTSELRAIRVELTDEAKRAALQGVKSIVFVDTPSFPTWRNPPDAQQEFVSWFDRITYDPQHVGMIYMHRIEVDPALEPIDTYLEELYKILQLCRARPLGVRIVMAYDRDSGVMSNSKITQRKLKLHAQVNLLSTGRWRPSIHEEYFQGEPEVAWRAVEELFNTDGGHF